MRRTARWVTILLGLTAATALAGAAPADQHGGGAAAARQQPVVVELFTSQGCSSCPPADALLTRLGEDADIIPLALHVDYWDYIGWKDDFAQAKFTERQKGYARAAGRSSVYTPQMVVNGRDDVIGTRPKDLAATIEAHRGQAAPVTLEASRSEGMLSVRAEAVDRAAVSDAHVYLVRYEPFETVAIRRGENAGRKIEYSYIVTDWDMIGRWNGRDRFEQRLPIEGSAPAVVLVQEAGYGPVLAAARLR